MRADVLYFAGCPNYEAAVELVRDVAAELGLEIELNEVEVQGPEDAIRLRFLGSPTIQVNGADVEPTARNRRDFAMACRTYDGQGLPDRKLVAAAMVDSLDLDRDQVGLLAALGSGIAAIGALACCWLPLLLIAIGASAGGVSAWFERYRLLFLITAVVLLGAGFALGYARRSACATASCCSRTAARTTRLGRFSLWLAAVLVLAAGVFPYAVAPDNPAAATGPGAGGEAPFVLSIDGMTCPLCAARVQNALTGVRGVQSASVSYPKRRATVIVDPEVVTDPGRLVEAVEAAGFEVTIDPAPEF